MTIRTTSFETIAQGSRITWEYSRARSRAELSRLRSMAMLLAYHILRNDPEASQSEANRQGWALAKQYEKSASILCATKKDGSRMKRVVLSNWLDYNEVKGTGRPLPDGVKLFVDLAKKVCGKPSTISARTGMYNLI